MNDAGASGPLDGIRVVDLTTVLMGPLSTRTLGDLGADVIVVETKSGDRNRSMGPGSHEQLSGISLNLMRNKRSLSMDLKSERGREVFLDLVRTCDVMITNLRPGPLGRLGLDYDSIRLAKDDIVFCNAHGYPSDSEKADAPAYDDIIQSASGIGDLFRRIGSEPSLLPTLVADKVSGMTIAYSVLAALFHRSRTGQGQSIEIPMIDVMRAFVLTEHGSGAIPEPPVHSPGYPRILTPARKPQRTVDGWINVLPYDGSHYEALFTEGDRLDLLNDPRYENARARMSNSDSLYRDVATVLAQHTTAHWVEFCDRNTIPATEAASLDDLIAELPLTEHPAAGTYRTIPPPERFSETPPSVRRHAPLVGEHSHDVLAEIGYDDATIDALQEAGVIHQP
ncbi:MAG: CoA transferase [Actinomycetia bacterium]|nr:CoA transferase [Actinomycetes bacterium]